MPSRFWYLLWQLLEYLLLIWNMKPRSKKWYTARIASPQSKTGWLNLTGLLQNKTYFYIFTQKTNHEIYTLIANHCGNPTI